LVAKIAYGFSVLTLGLDHIKDHYVLPAILGKSSDIGRWVGCYRTSTSGDSTGLHVVTARMEGKENRSATSVSPTLAKTLPSICRAF
jgi:hypothetical protein